jgi:protein-S-isoprenylcysteine O-methyltransferase Ste14
MAEDTSPIDHPRAGPPQGSAGLTTEEILAEHPVLLNPVFLQFVSLIGIAMVAVFVIWPAQKWWWPEGWGMVLSFYVFMSAEILILRKRNPQVILSRLSLKQSGKTEAEGADKWIMPLISLSFIGVFILPGFDEAYGWSSVHWAGKLVGFAITWLGFALILKSMLDNPYAAKVLDVRDEDGQKVIDTGSYSIVRHPLYTGFSCLSLGIPIALGSWWSLIPAACMVVLLSVRITFEERMLVEGLEGYKEYQQRVKYKLIPGIF